MPTVETTSPTGMPTLLLLASRARREVTKETLATLNDDVVNNIIVDSINDAIEDIYFRAKWSWAKVTSSLTMVASQSEYTFPADFHRLATEIEIGSTKLPEVDAEEWARKTYVSGIGIVTPGQPTMYMVDRTFVKFFPTPSADFITTVPTVALVYYRRPAKRMVLADSASAPDIPVEFKEALVRFAMGRLKIFRQFDDFGLDLQRYEDIVQRQLNANTVSVHPPRIRPRNWASANYG